MHIHFVYVLQSQAHPEHYYVGLTSDIASRVASHNAGTTQSTRSISPRRPAEDAIILDTTLLGLEAAVALVLSYVL